jgi:hypothetical protein
MMKFDSEVRAFRHPVSCTTKIVAGKDQLHNAIAPQL